MKIRRGRRYEERWLVSIDAVQALSRRLGVNAVVPRILRALAAEICSRRRTRWMSGELVAALRELEHRLGRAEALAELTVRSETSLREDLERVREKRARHQEEAERLRAELEAERARGFWQRLFGG